MGRKKYNRCDSHCIMGLGWKTVTTATGQLLHIWLPFPILCLRHVEHFAYKIHAGLDVMCFNSLGASMAMASTTNRALYGPGRRQEAAKFHDIMTSDNVLGLGQFGLNNDVALQSTMRADFQVGAFIKL